MYFTFILVDKIHAQQSNEKLQTFIERQLKKCKTRIYCLKLSKYIENCVVLINLTHKVLKMICRNYIK